MVASGNFSIVVDEVGWKSNRDWQFCEKRKRFYRVALDLEIRQTLMRTCYTIITASYWQMIAE